MLPSLPLFTLAGYLLVEGGAAARLLRVYTSLFGWLPGGLAITTAVGCAIFTWAGSGVTILSMGGLLLPMLVKARYPEKFSIGLINGSGSLGLLFPPSLPVILYGIYAKTAISTLFVAGFIPGLMMVTMVSGWGVFQALRSGAERTRFSFVKPAGRYGTPSGRLPYRSSSSSDSSVDSARWSRPAPSP
ncbi:MAG: TRAP transporter large permease subunit [Ignavibacteriota bacterium]